jgi:hypothetical protein
MHLTWFRRIYQGRLREIKREREQSVWLERAPNELNLIVKKQISFRFFPMGGQCKWAIRFDNKTGKWPSYGPAASLSTGEREGRKNKIKTWRKGKVVSSFYFIS